MKKITLLFCVALTLSFGYAQETISFEAAGGYTLGTINGQNGWVVTGDGAGGFVANQEVSDEQSTDGTNSLKIDVDPAFAGQANPVVGAFYNFAAPVPNTMATFSADMWIDTFDSATTSDYIFGLVNLTDGVFRTFIRFTFEGNITVLVDDGAGTIIVDDTMVDWTPMTWFNVRIEYDSTTLEFFIDNVSIYSGAAPSSGSIEQVRFSHDNFAGFAYIDNFRTNDEPLSVDDFQNNVFKHFYNGDTDTLSLDSSNLPFDSIEIYSVLGQKISTQSLSGSNEFIEMSSYKDGIYVAKVGISGSTQTIKFLKQ